MAGLPGVQGDINVEVVVRPDGSRFLRLEAVSREHHQRSTLNMDRNAVLDLIAALQRLEQQL